MNRQVSRQHEEFPTVVRSDQIGIAHAPFPQVADQNRFALVQRVPLTTIPAHCELDLLGHRSLLALEGSEKITVRPKGNGMHKHRN